MKQIIIFCLSVLSFANLNAQGVTLLFKGGGSGGWNDPVNWIQIHTPAGQTPIQRAPTELDDVVFSGTQSGLPSIVINFDSQLDHIISIGFTGINLYRCHSMHVSNTDVTFAPDFVDPLYIDVSTLNGGLVLIDSGSNFHSGQFRLHGGNGDISDLEINNSTFGRLFRVNDQSDISWDPTARARFVNSILGGYRFESSSTGGTIYADNCEFTTTTFKLGANSIDTIKNTRIHDDVNTQGLGFHIGRDAKFVSSNVKVSAFEIMDFYTSGSVLNGNVSCDHAASFFNFGQEDAANPLPNIINGNLSLIEDNSVAIRGDVKISGNLENTTVPQAIYPDTAHVFINGQDIFEVGGITNYGNSLFISNCVQNYCHFNLEFYGNTNSNILWPIGFPIDTLVVNKSGCAKVTVTNSLYVSGQAKIKSGQLVLDPNVGVPYKFACAGDLNISEGGGLFLRRDLNGTVANMAIAGNFTDYNTVTDSSCTGFSNPYNGEVTLYNEVQYPSNHEVNITSNTVIGNLNLVGGAGAAFQLGKDLAVHDLDFVNPGKVLLGDHNLVVNGSILHAGAGSYIVTNGTGYLQIDNIGAAPVFFPVGSTSSSYTPVTLTNMGTADNFNVNVRPVVLSAGLTGNPYISGVVNRTWDIKKATPGAANVTVNFQWNGVDELSGFTRNASYISHFIGGGWVNGPQMSATGSDPYSLTMPNVNSFSPFAVMSPAAVVPITLVDFSGKYENNAVALKWTTGTEVNTAFFTIEKSADAVAYKPITNIKASAGSQASRNYSHVDREALHPVNYYRLRIVDVDGSYTYSKTIVVYAAPGYSISVFPNPVSDVLYIRLKECLTATTLRIINAAGCTVRTMQVNPGVSSISFNIAELPAGNYSINLASKNLNEYRQFLKR